jgi:hypothetical protein
MEERISLPTVPGLTAAEYDEVVAKIGLAPKERRSEGSLARGILIAALFGCVSGFGAAFVRDPDAANVRAQIYQWTKSNISHVTRAARVTASTPAPIGHAAAPPAAEPALVPSSPAPAPAPSPTVAAPPVETASATPVASASASPPPLKKKKVRRTPKDDDATLDDATSVLDRGLNP